MEGKHAKLSSEENTRATATTLAPPSRRRPDDTVDTLFKQGLQLYEQKKFNEAEDAWKHALQINQTDMRTILYYGTMLREKGENEKAEQLMGQTMGDWHVYTTLGLKEPASPTELYRRSKMVSPKKDMQKMEFVRKSKRSHVQFYAMKTLQKQIEDMEKSGKTEENDETQEEEGDEETTVDGSFMQAGMLEGDETFESEVEGRFFEG
mmetsp:Transcript_10023/g.20029  ORF Transcript_10023/g.20029 Transcript_10023/m.20029 type:complete len:207 (-) Transcript_10023:61-681(-)|eukprot:CAMPEP_0181298382 /NCGR_PEP_ID=MMETSP1101-20121128/5750_1 /TAXON_ID=46948 /ORGANISM="Rhodomonas abbreviata, Strain Caron Lab Isolate" /LENGTH=206 /DNA_ID=CAMNT_0023403395 /DNA_START=169 /DNA_END=789 /DNA_ORIENTATION=-